MDSFLYLDQKRIGRLQYFLGGIKIMIIFVLLFGLGSFIGWLLESRNIVHLSQDMRSIILYCFSRIPCVILRIMQQVRRLHDLGNSGWLLLWCILPVGCVFIFPYLLFSFGQEKTNKYGKQVIFREQNHFEESEDSEEEVVERMKRCPFCGEKILQRAIKCKHCGEFLNKERETIEKTKRCPFCGEKNPQTAIECKYCGEYFSIGGEEKDGFTHHKI